MAVGVVAPRPGTGDPEGAWGAGGGLRRGVPAVEQPRGRQGVRDGARGDALFVPPLPAGSSRADERGRFAPGGADSPGAAQEFRRGRRRDRPKPGRARREGEEAPESQGIGGPRGRMGNPASHGHTHGEGPLRPADARERPRHRLGREQDHPRRGGPLSRGGPCLPDERGGASLGKGRVPAFRPCGRDPDSPSCTDRGVHRVRGIERAARRGRRGHPARDAVLRQGRTVAAAPVADVGVLGARDESPGRGDRAGTNREDPARGGGRRKVARGHRDPRGRPVPDDRQLGGEPGDGVGGPL